MMIRMLMYMIIITAPTTTSCFVTETFKMMIMIFMTTMKMIDDQDDLYIIGVVMIMKMITATATTSCFTIIHNYFCDNDDDRDENEEGESSRHHFVLHH